MPGPPAVTVCETFRPDPASRLINLAPPCGMLVATPVSGVRVQPVDRCSKPGIATVSRSRPAAAAWPLSAGVSGVNRVRAVTRARRAGRVRFMGFPGWLEGRWGWPEANSALRRSARLPQSSSARSSSKFSMESCKRGNRLLASSLVSPALAGLASDP